MLHRSWSHWPTARGWQKGRRHRREPDVEALNLFVLDPDFDDDDESVCVGLWRHEIEVHGCIPLHPDGDRRSPDDVPVPLLSHVPDGDTESAEFMNKKLYLKRRTREIREGREAVAKIEAERERKWQERQQAEPPEQPRTHERLHVPERWPEEDPVETPIGEMLRNMRVKEPVQAKLGRVWRNFVMINERDLNRDLMSRNWPEVWRGHGMVIFRMTNENEGVGIW
jgi:hypothetical protein